ncbi:MAG: histidine phosphatase family protein, partial [Exiguobacterium undae]
MTTIYLVRHAHSTYSPDEKTRPLSEQGTADAKQLISLFREVQPDYIYTSPYRRAIETVQPVAEHYGLPNEEAEAFQERLLAPSQLDDFQQAVEYVWNHPDKNPYGGESNDIAQHRV